MRHKCPQNTLRPNSEVSYTDFVNLHTQASWAHVRRKQEEACEEYLGVFDESFRSPSWARFIRDGEVIWVRKVDQPKEDPRLSDEMMFDGIEWEAFLRTQSK